MELLEHAEEQNVTFGCGWAVRMEFAFVVDSNCSTEDRQMFSLLTAFPAPST